MGVTLTDVLLFGKAQSDDVDNATLVIYRRNILRWSALGGYLDIIVKGVSPLNLPDAIANSLSYVKAFGGTEQRNIPQPYTQVNYVTNTAQTAVDTGVMIDFAKNYEFEVECRAVSGSWYILQSRASASGNVTGIHGETSGSNIKLVVGNVTVCTSAITRTVGHKLYVKATLNNGTATLYVKDETANTEDTKTGSYGTSQPNPTAAVYLLGNAGGQYADINSDIYMARIKENDTVVMDYVPARQVATAGFYDTVSGTFKTAETPANLSADGNTIPTPDAPMDIVSNNGVLRIQGSATGTVTQTGDPTPTTPVEPEFYQNHGLLLRAIGEDADTYDASTQTITRAIGYRIFDGTEIFGSSTAYGKSLYISGAASAWGADRDKDVLCQYFLGTSSPSSGMPKFSCFFNASRHFYFRTEETATDFKAWLAELYANGTPLIVWFVKSTSTTESFTPSVYADGTVETIKDSLNNTATAEMLLSAGDYTDEQEIITGGITRKCGVLAFDGTETYWKEQISSNGRVYIRNNNIDCIIPSTKYTDYFCSHFLPSVANSPSAGSTTITSSGLFFWVPSGITTLTQWTDWLGAQYAAGTPVIVVYPLETPTTESVAGQTLQVQDGDNTLEITQASLSGLELEAEYQAAVSLTIQEVQDANLDPNVEVTIN